MNSQFGSLLEMQKKVGFQDGQVNDRSALRIIEY